jgi:hypothetical protein
MNRRYYSIFDYDNQRIGFVLGKGSSGDQGTAGNYTSVSFGPNANAPTNSNKPSSGTGVGIVMGRSGIIVSVVVGMVGFMI